MAVMKNSVEVTYLPKNGQLRLASTLLDDANDPRPRFFTQLRGIPMILRQMRGRMMVRWRLSTASGTLRDATHLILERFARFATFEAASAKILWRRLHYAKYG